MSDALETAIRERDEARACLAFERVTVAELRAEAARFRNAVREKERLELDAVRELDEARAVLRDFAEYDCDYGDNCPSNSGTRHGTCVGCKARQALVTEGDR